DLLVKYRVVFKSDTLRQKNSGTRAVLVIREQSMTVSKWPSGVGDAALLLEVIASDDGAMGRVAPVCLISRRSSFGNGFRRSRSADQYGPPNDSGVFWNDII